MHTNPIMCSVAYRFYNAQRFALHVAKSTVQHSWQIQYCGRQIQHCGGRRLATPVPVLVVPKSGLRLRYTTIKESAMAFSNSVIVGQLRLFIRYSGASRNSPPNRLCHSHRCILRPSTCRRHPCPANRAGSPASVPEHSSHDSSSSQEPLTGA